MAYWKTGTDERERFAKLSAAARLLYIDAGAWCLEQVHDKRGELPDEWFVPASLVREWGKKNAAPALVQNGLWERAEINGVKGYIHHCIKFENTPAYIGAERVKERHAQRRKRANRRAGGLGDGGACTWGYIG